MALATSREVTKSLLLSRIALLDKCITSLEEQIKSISSGHLDDVLEHVVNYYVPNDYIEVCSECKFPEKPTLEKLIKYSKNQKIENPLENLANEESNGSTETQQSYKKIKLDIDTSIVVADEDIDGDKSSVKSSSKSSTIADNVTPTKSKKSDKAIDLLNDQVRRSARKLK